MAADRTAAGLVRFHTLHKMTVMAHDPEASTTLGRIVARAGSADMDEVLDAYEKRFRRALTTEATPSKHIHVMRRLANFLRRKWSPAEKASWAALLESYRRGDVSRMAPLTALRQAMELHGIDACVRSQLYLHAAGDAFAADSYAPNRRYARRG